jgi:hypothetical protein
MAKVDLNGLGILSILIRLEKHCTLAVFSRWSPADKVQGLLIWLKETAHCAEFLPLVRQRGPVFPAKV